MPEPPPTSVFRYRSGVLLDPDRAVVLAGHRELERKDAPHTFVFLWRRSGEWAGRRLAWSAVSVTAVGTPPETLVVGEDGQYACFQGSDVIEGLVGQGAILSGVYRAGDQAYAVGLRGALYRKRPAQDWVPRHPPIGRQANLEAIAGTSDTDLVGVGWQGQIWRFSGDTSERLDAGTNVILTSVCLGGDGHYYACGQRGTVVSGRGEIWTVVEHDSTREDLWNVHWFQGELYVASMRFLYRLRNGRLDRVTFGRHRVLSCYNLTSFQDQIMWSIGSEDIVQYDGAEWDRILGQD